MKDNLCFISVDIEATGPTPGHYSMYELGACCMTTKATFERKIMLLPNARFSKASLAAVHTTKQKLLERVGVTAPRQAMRDFTEWAISVAGYARPVFVANNAPFDWMFIAWYFEEFNITNPFGHSALDMKAHYMGMAHVDWGKATLKEMARHCAQLPAALPHRALLDAEIQKKIFRALLRMNFHDTTKQLST